MKFWELITLFEVEKILQDGKDILLEVFQNDRWKDCYHWYLNFNEIVENQEREVLDQEIPNSLCEVAFSKSIRKYYLVNNNTLMECGEDFSKPEEPFIILNALDAYQKYGGSSLERVQEKVKVRV